MKLVENLRAVETGNRRIIEEFLHTIRYDTTPSTEYEIKYAKQYSILVKIGANQWIEEDLVRASDGKVIEHAVENMKHAILEHVYGEIYRDLRELGILMRNELSYRETPSMTKLEEIMRKITL
jgi:hypothetical protein